MNRVLVTLQSKDDKLYISHITYHASLSFLCGLSLLFLLFLLFSCLNVAVILWELNQTKRVNQIDANLRGLQRGSRIQIILKRKYTSQYDSVVLKTSFAAAESMTCEVVESDFLEAISSNKNNLFFATHTKDNQGYD